MYIYVMFFVGALKGQLRPTTTTITAVPPIRGPGKRNPAMTSNIIVIFANLSLFYL